MIEDSPKPIGEPLAAELEPEAELDSGETRTKSPWKAFILTGFLAGLIGAGGGGYGAYTALKKFSPAPVAQANVDLTPIETKMNQLSNRLAKAEAAVQKTANRPPVKTKPVDLSAIEDRLKILEAAPSPEIDPEALTALQAAQKDGFEWPDVSNLEDKIAALESQADTSSQADLPEDLMDRLTALETDNEVARTEAPKSAEDFGMMVEVMSKLESRLTALENNPASEPTTIVKRVSILAFPKDLMIEAAEANMEGSLIKKTLSRHIRVKDTNDPLTLIEGIESDLSEGLLAPAADKFERLPSPVRSAGQAWYESVKASL